MTLAVERLTVERGRRRVVDGVTLSVGAGEIVALVGPNGAGKTSLLEGLLGLLPRAGSVTFDGAPVSSFAARARVFSYMPDAAEPPAEVSVGTLVVHARRFGGGGAALADSLERRLDLAPLLRARAGELSRGEKRRLLLFGALCTARPVVVLDEPLGAFDPLQLRGVRDLLVERARAGAALLVSVHQMSDAETIADRVAILDGGRLLALGTLDELRARAGAPGAPLERVLLALLERARAGA